MVTTVTFSQFATANLNDNTNQLVGIGGGVNIISPKVVEWTTAGRPTPPFAGLLGYNTTITQYEYYDGGTNAWVQLQDSTSGVTDILTGTGLTGGPIVTTGTISFAPIAATSLWANTTGSSAVPTVIPLSTFLQSANNLSELTNTTLAQSNIGLIIGTDVQAFNSILTSVVDGTYTGNTNITTLGTIALGTWNGSVIGSAYGGTGQTTYALGDTLYSSVANTLSKLTGNTTATKKFLSQTGDGVNSAAPIWATISPSDIGTLTAHGILIGEGSSPITSLVLDSGQILIGSTGADPVAAAINSGTGILVGNSAGSITVSLSSVANLTLLSNISGVSNPPSANTLTATIDAAIGSTQGNILYRNGTVWTVLPPGTAGQFATSGGAAANISWSTGLLAANNLSDVVSASTAALNLFVTRSVVTTDNVGTADYGKTIVCTGASSYGVTLTQHSANKYVQISCFTTSNALVTIEAVSGTIALQASIVLGSGDSVLLFDDGTNFWIIQSWLQPCSVYAYLNANQSIPTGVETVVVFGTEIYDLGGFYNTGTGIYTPLLPGKWTFKSNITLGSSATSTNQSNTIYKNYSPSTAALTVSNPIGIGDSGSMTTYDQSMNGSTDNIRCTVMHNNSGAPLNALGDVRLTFFQGLRISLF